VYKRQIQWQSLGQYFDYKNHKIWYLDQGNAKEYILVLHGYPTSSYDYFKILETLSSTYRVIIPDHLGFGLSDKPKNYSYSLVDQADVIEALINKLNIEQCHLIAHDYGTSIATELIARHNSANLSFEIDQLILCNGSIHIEFSQLRLIQKLLLNKVIGPTIAPFISLKTFERNMRNIFYNADSLSQEEVKIMWQFIEYNKGKRVIPKITQYIRERRSKWDRWIGGLKKTQLNTLILWSAEEPVAVPIIAKTLNSEIKNSHIIWLENCGHFPMLECPEDWVKPVMDFIEKPK